MGALEQNPITTQTHTLRRSIMAYICATCFFDTGFWNSIKKAVRNYGYDRAAGELSRQGHPEAAASLRNQIKIGGC